MLAFACPCSNVMLNIVHAQTESGVVTKHNFGNKELHSKIGSALSCYVFQQFIFLTSTSQKIRFFFSAIEGVILNYRAAFIFDYLVCEQKQLQLHFPQLR
jgi:hypothetical protein